MIDAFDMIKDDPEMDGIVVVGEIGGDAEEILAQHIIAVSYTHLTLPTILLV